MHIGLLTHKQTHLSRLGKAYVEALERYIAGVQGQEQSPVTSQQLREETRRAGS